MLGLADPGNKPLSSAKVKPGGEWPPHDSAARYVRGITLPPSGFASKAGWRGIGGS